MKTKTVCPTCKRSEGLEVMVGHPEQLVCMFCQKPLPLGTDLDVMLNANGLGSRQPIIEDAQ